MSRAAPHRLTTLLVLASFLAANTLGGLLHDHSHGHDHEGTCCREHSDVDRGHHDDDGEGAFCVCSPHDDHALHDDDCVVCRFAGQRWLSVAVDPAGHFCTLCLKLASAPAESPLAALVRRAHCRAPPLPC